MNFTPPKDPLAYNSSRHHYIPEHYSKGFCDDNGMLYVYDKQKDIFLKNGRSPKAVFFEKDRNTIFNKDGGKISLLEDTMYKIYDQQCAPVISDFRGLPNSEDLYSPENLAVLTIFIVTLFWRTPMKWDDNKLTLFNIAIIDQAHRYVCGSDKALLVEYVKNYKSLKAQNLTDHFRLKLFTSHL